MLTTSEDHQPYVTTVNWKTYEKLPRFIRICKQTSADIDKFRLDLNTLNILENIDLNFDANSNATCETLDGTRGLLNMLDYETSC